MKIDLISYEQSKSKMKAVGRTEAGETVIMEYKGKNGVFDYAKPVKVLMQDGVRVVNYQIYVNGAPA